MNVETVEGNVVRSAAAPKGEEFDDDGRPRRHGTVWTATAHIITAVIGSGVLSLPWAMAQLGWVVGLLSLFIFSLVTFYASRLLADCYRTGDVVYGRRNYTYIQAVQSNLGGTKYWLCGLCQYLNFIGVSIGYTITASLSAAAVAKSNCFHWQGREADCSVQISQYMIAFGVIQMILSQLSSFHKIWWLSILAAIMSFGYSGIAVGLSATSIIEGDIGTTGLTGTVIGVDTSLSQKIWDAFRAIGNIAFAYTFSVVLIEIQDTLRSPPAENKVMKRASCIGVSVTTTFYVLCGCLGYAAFGNDAPGNVLTGFGFYEPFWLIDIANAFIVVHLLGAYQVFCQPLFSSVEVKVAASCPSLKVLTREHSIVICKWIRGNVSVFRVVWRSLFVILSTFMASSMPFFNDVLSFVGAVSFWPLTVYFPIEMYISQKKLAKYTPEWMFLMAISAFVLLISVAAAFASIEGITKALHNYTPFVTRS